MDFEVMEEVLSLRVFTRYGRGDFGRSDFEVMEEVLSVILLIFFL
jgi:hypothetical protein